MRNLLFCLAIGMFAGIVGCGESETPGPNPDVTPRTGETTTDVSIDFPHMTCGDCEDIVSEKLESIGATNIDADRTSNPPLATFRISADTDIDAELDKLAETTPELKDWDKH